MFLNFYQDVCVRYGGGAVLNKPKESASRKLLIGNKKIEELIHAKKLINQRSLS